MLTLEKIGVLIEAQHHEVATGGQGEIDMRFAPLVKMADNVLKYKYVLRMWRESTIKYHLHAQTLFVITGPECMFMLLWKGDQNLFYGDGYAGLSQMGMYAIGGILKHAPSLLAITSPTTNSYKRLVPGLRRRVNLAYSRRNRSAAVRIPLYSTSPKAKRLEFRCPDPSCNPYLAFSAILMAMLDGIQKKIHPGEPLDKDIYDLPAEELARFLTRPVPSAKR